MKRIVLILLLIIILFAENALAEPYKNKEFPSDQIITDCFNRNNQKLVFQYLGKNEVRPGVYRLYLTETFQGSKLMVQAVLTKLDTDMWIIESEKLSMRGNVLEK